MKETLLKSLLKATQLGRIFPIIAIFEYLNHPLKYLCNRAIFKN